MNKVEETYIYIKNYLAEKGYPPTIREICKGINIKSTSTISYYLKKLEESNRIVKGSYKNRALQLTEKTNENEPSENYISIPLIGSIAAGTPILAEQNLVDNVLVSETLFKGNNLIINTCIIIYHFFTFSNSNFLKIILLKPPHYYEKNRHCYNQNICKNCNSCNSSFSFYINHT